MKVPMYDKEPLARITVTISPEAFSWLENKENMKRLREILDEKLGTTTQRRKNL